MNTNQQHAREQMRQDICKAIRRNLVTLNVTIPRHDVVVILAQILAGQIEVICNETRKQDRAD